MQVPAWITCLAPVVLVAACDRSSATRRPAAIDPPASRGAGSPNLAAAAGGALLTWLAPMDETRTSHRLRFSRLADGRWSAPVTIAQGPSILANWADVPSVVAQDERTLVAHWAEKVASPNAYAYNVVLARSADGGASWQRIGSPHRDGTATEHGFVSLVPDGDAVLAVWLDGRAMANDPAGATALRAARIADTIEDEQIVDARVCDCCSTAATMTPDGPAIVYRDRTADEQRDPWIARRVAGAWTPPRAVHTDGWTISGCPVNGPAIASAGRDTVVAWYTYANQRAAVRIAFSGDAAASFDTAIDVDLEHGGRAPIGRVDVVIDRPGEAIVSWMASVRDEARVLVRRISRDGRLGPEIEVATNVAARDGGFPRMELVGGSLVFAWTDARAGRLRAAQIARASIPSPGGVRVKVGSAAAPSRTLGIGDRVPDYRAVTRDGSPAALASLRGQPVLVNVWATWCEPCRQELPLLAALQRAYAARGLRIVAINVDREEPRDDIAALAGRLGPGLEIWYDPQDLASTAFGVGTLPATLLLDREGKVAWRRDGALAEGDTSLEAAFERALNP